MDDLDDGNSVERQKQCLGLCRFVDGVTGCELKWGDVDKGCYAHTELVVHGKDMEKGKGSLCLIFSKCLGTFRRFKLKKHFAIVKLEATIMYHLNHIFMF